MANVENYSNVVQTLAKEIVATCTAIIKENNEKEVKQLIKTTNISANQITGGITANKLTGNITTAQIQDFDLISANIARAVIDVAEIDVARIQNLQAEVAKIAAAEIQNAMIDAANINNLSAEVAKIVELYVDEADIDAARIRDLEAAVANIVEAHIQWADVENLEAYVANIADARIAHAEIGEADVENLKAYAASIVDAAIQNATIDTAQINNLSAAVADLLVANIASANIDWADINSLTAAVADIVNANIAEAQISYAQVAGLDAHVATIADAQIGNATIDAAQIQDLSATVADIADAQIANATIDAAKINNLDTAVATIADAQIANAQIDAAQITDLNAAVANVASATIDSASIRYGQITGLDATQALITKGVGEKLYIRDLAVTDANIASLQAGEIIVEGDDGQFYSITVDGQGNVVAEIKQVENDNILDGTINGAQKVLAGSITAETLNIADIFANNALIRQLMAQNIDTTTLFARQATIEQLNTADLSSNSSLRMLVASNNVIKSPTAPTDFETNTMWINTSTGALKYWDGDEWSDYDTLTSRFTSTEPVGFDSGALWVNMDKDKPSLWTWDGLMWVRDVTAQVGTTAPTNTSVYWVDTSGSTPVVKRNIGGTWSAATSIVSATAPIDTRKTILWIDPSKDYKMYRWDGNEWYEFNGLNGNVIKDTATPVGPMVDTLWLDTSGENDELKRWDGQNWVGSGMAELKVDINSITSRVVDAEGRLSAIEQTAQGLVMSVENIQFPKVAGRNLLADTDHVFTRTKDSDSVEVYRFNLAKQSSLDAIVGNDMVLSYYVYCPGDRQNGLLYVDSTGNTFGACLTLKWGNSDGEEKIVTTVLDGHMEKDNLSGRVEETIKVEKPEGYDTLLDAYVTMQLVAKPASTNDATWQIGQPYLAYGTTTPGYAPAIEDTEDTIATMRSEFKMLSDRISMFVTKEQYNADMIDLNGLISDADGKAVTAQTIAENAKTVADSAASDIAHTLRDVIGVDNENDKNTILYKINNAELTISDESIRAAVQSSTAFQELSDAIGSEDTEDSILWRINQAEQVIEPDNIVSMVTSSKTFGDDLSARLTNYSTVTQTANAISAAVGNITDETDAIKSRVGVLEGQISATVSRATYDQDMLDQEAAITAIETAAAEARDKATSALTAIGDENTAGSILYRLKDAKLDITDDYIRQTVFNSTTYSTENGTVGAAIHSIQATSELVDALNKALNGDPEEETPGVLSRLTAAEQEISGNAIVSRVISSQEFEAYSNQALAAYNTARELRDAVNNKNKTYASATAPTPQDTDLIEGDLWIDIENNNTPYRWDGERWESIDNLGDNETPGTVRYRLSVAEQKITDENITLQVRNVYGDTIQGITDQLTDLDNWVEGAKLQITPDGIYQIVKGSDGYTAERKMLQDDISAAASAAQSALDIINDTEDEDGNVVKGLISRVTEAESLVTDEAITNKIRSTNAFKNLENAIGDTEKQGSILYRLNEAENKLTDTAIYNAVARTETFTNTLETLEAAKSDASAALELANKNATLIGDEDAEGTLINRVVKAEQKIEPDQIVQTVREHSDYVHDLGEKADISMLDSYSTIEQTQDMIQSTVEKIYTTPSGGVNMLSDTKRLIPRSPDEDSAYIYRYQLVNEVVLNDLINQDVTLSYYLDSPGDRAAFIGNKAYGDWFGGMVEVTWGDGLGTLEDKVEYYLTDRMTDSVRAKRVRVSGKLEPPEGYNEIKKLYATFFLFAKPASTNDYTWSIGKPKLEMGLFATDYTVAPEDNDLIIASLKSQIKQTEDKIELMVTREEYNRFVGEDFENLKSAAQDAITDAENAISATSDLQSLINGEGEDDENSVLYQVRQAYSAVKDGVIEDRVRTAVIESVGDDVDEAVRKALSGSALPESIDVQYAKSTSNSEPPSSTSSAWGTEAPAWEDGYYIWQRTVITYKNSEPEISEPVCISGAKGADGTSVTILGSFDTESELLVYITGKTFENGDGFLVNGELYVFDGTNWTNVGQIAGPPGVGISGIEEQYYQSTSDDHLIGGEWLTEQPKWVTGTYLWTRSMVYYTDGTQSPTKPQVATTLNDLLRRAANIEQELGDESTQGTIRYIVKDYSRVASDEAIYEAISRVTTYKENMQTLEDLRNTVGSGETTGTLLQRMNVVESLTTPDSIVTTVRESSQYANDLEAKADKTELEKYSTIEQTSDMIRLSVSSMENQIIGGTNMLTNTKNYMTRTRDDDSAEIYRYQMNEDVVLDELIGQNITLSYYLNNPGQRMRAIGGKKISNWFGGLIEVEWKSSNKKVSNKVSYYGMDRMEATDTGSRVKVTDTLIAPDGYDGIEKMYATFFLVARPGDTNINVWKIGKPKLEVGSFATDYTASPADNDRELERLETSFTIKLGEIESLVKSVSDDVEKYAKITVTDDGIVQIAQSTKTIEFDSSELVTAINNRIESVKTLYSQNNSPSKAPTTGWSEVMPESRTGYYIWVQSVYVYPDDVGGNIETYSAPVCLGERGDNGVVVGIEDEYCTTNNPSTPPGINDSWAEEYPGLDIDKYVWMRTRVIYDDGTEETTAPSLVNYDVQRAIKLVDDVANGAIASIQNQYNINASYYAPPAEDDVKWRNEPYEWAKGQYIWMRTASTSALGDVTYSNPVCVSGMDGVGISETRISYQASNSATTPPTGTWRNEVVETTAGQYLWTKRVIVYTDGRTSSPEYNVVYHATDGANTFIAYANDNKGTNISKTPSDKRIYIGFYKSSEEQQSMVPSKYTWSIYKATIKSIEVQYAITTTNVQPTTGWSTSAKVANAGEYLWTKTTTTFTDGTSHDDYNFSYHAANGNFTHFKWCEDDPTEMTAAQLAKITMLETPAEFIGVLIDNNAEDSTNPADYKWSRFEGRPGVTPTVKFAYANGGNPRATGFEWSETYFDGATHLGVVVDNGYNLAGVYKATDYTWSSIVGATPSGIVEQYCILTTGTSPSGSTSWVNTCPTWAKNKSIWTRTQINWTDGHTTYTEPVLATVLNKSGADASDAKASASTAATSAANSSTYASAAAKSADDAAKIAAQAIIGVDVEYNTSTDPVTAPSEDDPGWSTTAPAWENGKYMWQRTVTTYGNDVSISEPTCISGANGKDGKDGTGINLLGTYESIEALKMAHPTANQGDSYMVNGSLYVWSDDEWINCGNIQGPQGKSISAVTTQYYLSTSKTKCTGGSWKAGEPTWVTGRYLWVRYGYTYEGESGVAFWSAPAICSTYNKLLADQADVFSQMIKGIVIKYVRTDSAAIPPDQNDNWVTDVTQLGEGKYLWQCPFTTYYDTNIGEYMGDPVCIKAADGVSMTDIKTQYYLSTSDKKQTGGSWQNTEPVWTDDFEWVNGKAVWNTQHYVWTRSQITMSDGEVKYSTPMLANMYNEANKKNTETLRAYQDMTDEGFVRVMLDRVKNDKGETLLTAFSQVEQTAHDLSAYFEDVGGTGKLKASANGLTAEFENGGRVAVLEDTVEGLNSYFEAGGEFSQIKQTVSDIKLTVGDLSRNLIRESKQISLYDNTSTSTVSTSIYYSNALVIDNSTSNLNKLTGNTNMASYTISDRVDSVHTLVKSISVSLSTGLWYPICVIQPNTTYLLTFDDISISSGAAYTFSIGYKPTTGSTLQVVGDVSVGKNVTLSFSTGSLSGEHTLYFCRGKMVNGTISTTSIVTYTGARLYSVVTTQASGNKSISIYTVKPNEAYTLSFAATGTNSSGSSISTVTVALSDVNGTRISTHDITANGLTQTAYIENRTTYNAYLRIFCGEENNTTGNAVTITNASLSTSVGSRNFYYTTVTEAIEANHTYVISASNVAVNVGTARTVSVHFADGNMMSLNVGASTTITYTPTASGFVRVYAGSYGATDGVRVTISGFRITQLPYYTSGGKFYRELVTGLAAGNYMLSINNIYLRSGLTPATAIDYEFVRDGSDVIAYSGSFVLNNDGTRYVDNNIALSDTRYSYSLRVYAGSKGITQNAYVVLTETQLESRTTGHTTASDWQPHVNDAGTTLSNGVVEINKYGVSVSGGSVNINANSAFSVASGGTVKIDAEDSESYIRFGGTPTDPLFYISPGGSVKGQAAEFDSLVIGGQPITRLIQSLASSLVVEQPKNNIVFSATKPSGHGILWLEPQAATTTTTTTTYGGYVEFAKTLALDETCALNSLESSTSFTLGKVAGSAGGTTCTYSYYFSILFWNESNYVEKLVVTATGRNASGGSETITLLNMTDKEIFWYLDKGDSLFVDSIYGTYKREDRKNTFKPVPGLANITYGDSITLNITLRKRKIGMARLNKEIEFILKAEGTSETITETTVNGSDTVNVHYIV